MESNLLPPPPLSYPANPGNPSRRIPRLRRPATAFGAHQTPPNSLHLPFHLLPSLLPQKALPFPLLLLQNPFPDLLPHSPLPLYFFLETPLQISTPSRFANSPLQFPFPLLLRHFADPSHFGAGHCCTVVWFRADLPVYDNEALTAATNDSLSLLPVYIFDPPELRQVLFRLR